MVKAAGDDGVTLPVNRQHFSDAFGIEQPAANVSVADGCGKYDRNDEAQVTVEQVMTPLSEGGHVAGCLRSRLDRLEPRGLLHIEQPSFEADAAGA